MDISIGNWIRRPMVNSRKNSRNQSWERSQHCCRASGKHEGESLGLRGQQQRTCELIVFMTFYCYSYDGTRHMAGPHEYDPIGGSCSLELECQANIYLEDRVCYASETVTGHGEGMGKEVVMF